MAQVEQPIVNGTAESDATAEGAGFVKLDITTSDPQSSTCSGTLIRNDLILTAQHCLEGLQLVRMGTKTFSIDAKFRHSSQDVALVQLSQLAPMGSTASKYDYFRPILVRSPA